MSLPRATSLLIIRLQPLASPGGSTSSAFFVPSSWSPDNPQNRPISKHTKHDYTLSAIGGNDATGIEDHPQGPKAARKKGQSTAEAVNGTTALISVATLRGGAQPSADKAPPPGNWFLVYHRADGEVRLEVSLPLGFDAGQFTGWRVRVILPTWAPDSAAQRPLDVGGQDVDFRVDEVS